MKMKLAFQMVELDGNEEIIQHIYGIYLSEEQAEATVKRFKESFPRKRFGLVSHRIYDWKD